MFAEEPLPPEDVAGLAADHRADRRCRSRPASGWSAAASSRRRSRRAPSTSPSPTSATPAGCCEAKKIAAMAETAGIGLAPHNPLGPIAGVAALHFGISTPNVIIQEEMSGAVAWYDDVVTWPIERKPGRWDVPLNARPRHRGRRGRHRRASVQAGDPARPQRRDGRRHRGRLVSAMAGRLQGKIAHRHRRRPGHRRGDRPRLRRARAPASSSPRMNADDRRGRRRRSLREPAAARCSSRPTSPTRRSRGRAGRDGPSSACGGIDILVNNAGANVFYEPLAMPEEEWKRCLELDLEAAWTCAQRGAAGHAGARRRRDRQHRQLPRLQDHPAHLPLSRRQARAGRADAGARHRICGARHPRERDRARLHRDADRRSLLEHLPRSRTPSGSGPTTSIRPSASAGRRRSP